MAKRLAKFDPQKHPRGYHGWFIETPDRPKSSKGRNGKADAQGTSNSRRSIRVNSLTDKQQRQLLESFVSKTKPTPASKPLANARVYSSDIEARKLLLSRMSRAQLERLNVTLLAHEERRKRQESEAKAKAEEEEAKTKAEGETKAETEANPKTSKLTTHEKAAKEAEKAKVKADKEAERARKQAEKEAVKAAKEAEKQRIAEEKAAKEAEKLAKIAATGSKARKKASDLLKGQQYKGVEPLETINRYSIKAENGMPVLPKEPTARPKVDRSNINFDGDKVEIWQGQPELGKHTGGFQVKRDKGYKCSVEIDGKEVVLNRNENMFIFEGERVHGVPSIHARLREIDNDNLVSRLAESMQHVENHVDRSIKAPAIDWSETYHGKVNKDLLKLNGEEGKYGGAEIHHIDQWAKRSFKSVTDRLDSGEITVEQAKEEMSSLLTYMHDKAKVGGSVYADIWRIDPAKLGDRDLVILPAGAHNFTSTTLYSYLHPEGIHPETGKRAEFGIPITGDSGREYFDAWNRRFWAEYNRREAYILRQEINRRLGKGSISMDEVKHHWETATAKQARDHAWQKQQSKDIKPIKKTILEDFIGERKFWTGKYKD